MKRTTLNNGKILISFTKEEFRTESVKQLIDTLNKLPPEVCKQSGNEYNYLVTPDVLSLTRDTGYGPFTEKEWIDGELELLKFMNQFDDPIEL